MHNQIYIISLLATEFSFSSISPTDYLLHFQYCLTNTKSPEASICGNQMVLIDVKHFPLLKLLLFEFSCLFSLTACPETQCGIQAGLKLVILLLWLPQYWGYRQIFVFY